ncbi:hypothetical protein [Bacillus cereus]|uniref:hypothetical protein n=1 Tax=Bacillus cereus TaxID=1396 RepID=UPI001B8B3D33|nr:hypothetical protein [Bacillus cereus]QUW38203.1 hypothetical protein J8Y18_05660 [Bacillus cereus]
MEFTFEKVQRIEDANIYRVSNITDIYETDLFDDYNRNVDNLSLLVQERINQFIVHVDKSEEKNVKEEIESKNISYTVFDSIPRTEVSYIIKYFYGVSIENTFAIISLGNSVGIKLEEINQSKLMKCLMGECVVPQIELVPSSACAFIQYDGALLTIASNNFDIYAT